MSRKRYMVFTGTQSWGHIFFISKTEEIFSLGCNGYHQILHYTNENRTIFSKNGERKLTTFVRKSEITRPALVDTNHPLLKNTIKGRKIIDISCGYYHTLIVVKEINGDHTVYGCGNNRLYQCGKKINENESEMPLSKIQSLCDKQIVLVCCGENHSIFAGDKGDVYGLGNNLEGQLGCGDFKHHFCIVQMKKLPKYPQNKIIKISCGTYFSSLLYKSGDVYISGEVYNSNNKISLPFRININERIISIAAGCQHLIAISQTNVYGIGSNSDNQLTNEIKSDYISTPRQIKALKNMDIIDVDCGRNHTIVLTRNGIPYGFGHNQDGQIGFIGNASTPNQINFTNEKNLKIVQIEVSGYQSFLIDENGSVYSCGYNAEGQVGHGHNKTSVKEFKMIEGLRGNIKLFSVENSDEKMKDMKDKVKYFDIVIKTKCNI